MDALRAAATSAAGGRDPVVVIVPTAAARQRPDLAARHGEQAFRAAAARAGIAVTIATSSILSRADASDRGLIAPIEVAHLVHLPGGDPDLIPDILRETPAWSAILEAVARGACLAGASAGAMALGERLWTPRGGRAGLGLLAGVAVLPHFDAQRLATWRATVEPEGQSLTWVGLDEQTLVMGRPGGEWTVAGRGRAHRIGPGDGTPVSAAAGERLSIG
jgi:cyanophycinase-like exopeptidase